MDVLLPGFVVSGIGIGTVNPVLASSAISVVPPQRSGMASGANNTFRQVGIATGIAGLGTVFQSQIESRTLSALAQLAVRTAGGVPRGRRTAGSVGRGRGARGVAIDSVGRGAAPPFSMPTASDFRPPSTI